MKKSKTQKGITLIALIITIVMLLILAVVAISAIQNEKIFLHAQNATNKFNQAQQNEQAVIGGHTNLIDKFNGGGNNIPVGDVTILEAQEEDMLEKETNSIVYDKYGNKIVVPAGFKILVDSSTVYNSSNLDVTKGIVITDDVDDNGNSIGNEFVWIPVGLIKTSDSDTVGTKITLGRYTFSENETTDASGKVIPIGTPTLSQPIEGVNTYESSVEIDYQGQTFIEHQSTTGTNNGKARNISHFYKSAVINEGYYIGRYEAKDGVTDTVRNSSTSDSNKVSCSKNDYIYNHITQAYSSNLSKQMYPDNYKEDGTGTFSSDLVNSYAWDTAIVFIQTFSGDKDYSRQRSLNTTFASKGTANGNVQDKVCNIYDMASNCFEWTTETSTYQPYAACYRSDSFSRSSVLVGSPSVRFKESAYITNGQELSFRPVLYLGIDIAE